MVQFSTENFTVCKSVQVLVHLDRGGGAELWGCELMFQFMRDACTLHMAYYLEHLRLFNYTTLISGVDILNVGPASEIVVSKGKFQLETTIEFELPRFKYAGIPPEHIAFACTRD